MEFSFVVLKGFILLIRLRLSLLVTVIYIFLTNGLLYIAFRDCLLYKIFCFIYHFYKNLVYSILNFPCRKIKKVYLYPEKKTLKKLPIIFFFVKPQHLTL